MLKLNATFIYLGIIVPLTIIVPILFAVSKYHFLSLELKIASWYLFLSGATNLLTSVLAFKSISNMPVMHIYTCLEMVLLGLFYRVILQGTRVSKSIPYIIAAFVVACIINVLYFQDIFTFNTYTKSLEALIIIFLAVCYFKNKLDSIAANINPNNTILFINSGLLLYFSGSFVVFIIENINIHSTQFWFVMWNIHGTLVVALYQLFAIAIWKYKK